VKFIKALYIPEGKGEKTWIPEGKAEGKSLYENLAVSG